MIRFWERLVKKRNLQFDTRAITRIDVIRQPTLVVENFWIVLFSGENVTLEVADHEPGYEDFRREVLKAWPEIEKPMDSVFCGPPDIEERVTLWKQRESY